VQTNSHKGRNFWISVNVQDDVSAVNDIIHVTFSDLSALGIINTVT
jgi:hypothetical protein